MIGLITAGIFAIVIIAYFVIRKAMELSEQKHLNELVAWCVTDNSNEYRNNLSLLDYIKNAQIKYCTTPELRIVADEWDTVKLLIENFQNDTIQNYFCKHLKMPPKKIDGESYFMCLLQEYLEKHQCDSYFLENKMHMETVSRKDYGSWGGQLYDATYSITDFALVFHKLYYISYMFCKNSTKLNPNMEHFTCEKSIEEVIASKTISISKF